MPKINFEDWESKFFNPYLWDHALYQGFGCGSSVLSMLTGVDPKEYYLKNEKSNPFWHKSFILKELKKYFKILELTDKNLKQETGIINNVVGDYHIVLVNSVVAKGESSWLIFWGGYAFHNFQIYKLKCLEGINNRIISKFILKKL